MTTTTDDDAVRETIEALTNKGKVPPYHDDVRRRHAAEWPTLHRALDRLEAAARATRPGLMDCCHPARYGSPCVLAPAHPSHTRRCKHCRRPM